MQPDSTKLLQKSFGFCIEVNLGGKTYWRNMDKSEEQARQAKKRDNSVAYLMILFIGNSGMYKKRNQKGSYRWCRCRDELGRSNKGVLGCWKHFAPWQRCGLQW